MKGSTARRVREHNWYVPMLHRQLGLSVDNHVNALKGHIREAGLMPADGKLDLVVVDSLEHYEELLSGGVPMARIEDASDSPPSGRVVQLPLWRYRLLLLAAVFMPSIWMWPHRIHQAWELLRALL